MQFFSGDNSGADWVMLHINKITEKHLKKKKI